MARERVFVAINCPGRVATRIEAECAELGSLLRAFRTSPPASLHLTLAFLAERTAEEILIAAEVMANVAEQFSPFEVSLGGFGFFPSAEHPKVVWIGVREGAEEITQLHEALVEEMAAAIPYRDSPFHPHLTIGRWKMNRKVRHARHRVGKPTPEELAGLLAADIRIPAWKVDAIQLHSNQGRSSDGAYPILASGPLVSSKDP